MKKQDFDFSDWEGAVDMDKLQDMEKELGVQPVDPYAPNCPLCGHAMVLRMGSRGKFYGCSKYPHCKGILNQDGTKPKPPSKRGRKVGHRDWPDELVEEYGALFDREDFY